MPRAPPPARRAGSYDHFLNFQIVFVILLQLALCVFCAVASYIWREKSGIRHYDLALDADVQAQCPPALRPLCGHTSDIETLRCAPVHGHCRCGRLGSPTSGVAAP